MTVYSIPQQVERALESWELGDRLAFLDISVEDINNHPSRGQIALLAGSSNLNAGNINAARKFVYAARDWGCNREAISHFLINDVTHTLHRARELVLIDTPDNILKNKSNLGSDSNEGEKSHEFRVEKYWDERYKSGGNSGFGSYGRLANFKAQTINSFIEKHNIQSAIEFGCGDGNQLSMFLIPKYIGVDISPTAVLLCQKKFEQDMSKEFFSTTDFMKSPITADLTLSLDVIFHLVEENIFSTYMTTLFRASNKFCIIYASDSNERGDPALHVRHRRFSDWIAQHQPDWKILHTIYNDFPHDGSINPKDSSFSNFYIYKRN